MDAQDRVTEFFDRHDLGGGPAYQALDLASEVGEIAGDAAKSTAYGERPDDLAVKTDELGDALFSLLSLCNSLDVDADEALDEAIEKYETRIDARDDPGSRPDES
ncbi:MazG nucleotide pyrophosphohydrolase domain-containing protein [Halobaculum marinum]|uniref:MazG nucleotide pyrophosphohydrolase domain-containing protein n=1 Tax=Halobaculum marinum TaxID=3031996 RepID=A0ABD5X2K9_9EURY|nr:MazG nucleotide pyrophosphohydrolase domain-containing protein [Halobaculum sp. DT55]